MSPQSEGGPLGDGRNYGGQAYMEDGRRHPLDRDISVQDQLPRPNGAFASEARRTASPAGSNSSNRGRDGDEDLHKSSGERDRSRTRHRRQGSGQVRLCKKCDEPLTGQFVRALGGTFHLDCFKCRVRNINQWPYELSISANLMTVTGLRPNRCVKVFPCR